MKKTQEIVKLLGIGLGKIIVWFWLSFVWIYISAEIMPLFYKTTDPINWMSSLRLITIFITYMFPIAYFAFKLFIPGIDSLSQIYYIIRKKNNRIVE
jgi:hypothetical protein